jgi:hypothetical protein
MMNLEIKGIESQSYNEAANQNCGAAVIDFERAFATLDSRSLELFEAQFSDVTSLSTVAARRFASADLTLESDIHTFDVGGMHRTGVVPTRSWGSPRVDNFATDLNAHGVSSFNGLDSLPTNCDFLQGIGDSYSFVEDFNFGANEEQIGTAQYKSSPRNSDEVSFDATTRNSLNYERENNQSGYSRIEPNSSWAEGNEIIHTRIFSQQSGLEGSQS